MTLDEQDEIARPFGGSHEQSQGAGDASISEDDGNSFGSSESESNSDEIKLSNEFSELKEQLREFKVELQKKKNEVKYLNEEKAYLEVQIKKVQDDNSQLKAKVEVAEKEKDGLIKQTNQLIDEIAQFKEEKNGLKKQIDQLNKKNGQLKDENINLENKFDNFRIRINYLEVENKRLKGKKLLPMVLSILLGALALAILFRVLLVKRNSDSELQGKFDEKTAECVELQRKLVEKNAEYVELESWSDSVCKENIVLLAKKDSLLRVNDSIIKSNTQHDSSIQEKLKIDSHPTHVGLNLSAYYRPPEKPEKKFWIDVKRAICLRRLGLKCNQTGSAVIQAYRYKDEKSILVFEQEVFLQKFDYNQIELIDFYLDQAGLYYLIICNNHCGSFNLEKVTDDWEFKWCFSDDLDILGAGTGETPPQKKDKFTNVFDYGYFANLVYCRIAE